MRPLCLLRRAPPLLPLRLLSPGQLAPYVRLDCCRVVIAPRGGTAADAMRPCCPGSLLPVLAVGVLSRCARAATSARPYCRPSRSPPPPAPRAHRPPGSCPPAASVAAVIRRGPLSRYACYDCNNYIDLLYILYLQPCIMRYDYKPFMHCIRWSIWHFLREFLGSVTVDI